MVELILPLVLAIVILVPIIIVCFLNWKSKEEHININSNINEDVKNEIILRLFRSRHLYRNSYFYKTILAYDEQDIDGQQYKERGIEFEGIINQIIRKLLANQPDIQYFYQWNLGGGICDFVMLWNDYDRKKHSIIIECKHSDSRDPWQKERQIVDGIEQLNRYSQIVKNRRRYKVDLTALLVDFPIPGSSPIKMRNEVMIFNVSMLEELINGVVALKNKQCYMPPKEVSIENISSINS